MDIERRVINRFKAAGSKTAVAPFDAFADKLFKEADKLYDARGSFLKIADELQKIYEDPTGDTGFGMHADPTVKRVRDNLDELGQVLGRTVSSMEGLGRTLKKKTAVVPR